MDPILILSLSECPEGTSLHGPGASSSQGRALAASFGMLLAGIWEWKISGEEGALTRYDTCWVLLPPSALR